jgi:hypothetical protein
MYQHTFQQVCQQMRAFLSFDEGLLSLDLLARFSSQIPILNLEEVLLFFRPPFEEIC